MFTRKLSCKNAWGLHNGGFQKKQSTSLDNSNRCDRIELPQLFLQHVSLLNGSDIISLPSICHSKLHRLLKQNIGLFCWGIQKSVIFRFVNLISYTNMTDIQGILLILDITSWHRFHILQNPGKSFTTSQNIDITVANKSEKKIRAFFLFPSKKYRPEKEIWTGLNTEL